jgi:arylamine N-acetyltransferase
MAFLREGLNLTDEIMYLEQLGVQKSPPTLQFLCEIIKRSLANVPYENVSKLIRYHAAGPSIPDFAEFIDGIVEKSFGGTCFSQNIQLNRLLYCLGFKSRLVRGRREGFFLTLV